MQLSRSRKERKGAKTETDSSTCVQAHKPQAGAQLTHKPQHNFTENTDRSDNTMFVPTDPATWGLRPDSGDQQLQELFERLRPFIKDECTDAEAQDLLSVYLKHRKPQYFPKVLFKKDLGAEKITDYTKKMLNNQRDPASMPLVQRDDVLTAIYDHFKHEAKDKPRAVRLLSTRGSGKTQLIKYLLYQKYRGICPHGVILVECSKGGENANYLRILGTVIEKGEECDKTDVARFTVDIIAEHMRRFVEGGNAAADTLALEPPNVLRACRLWKELCDNHHNNDTELPYCLIVFDTIERLPKMTQCNKTTAGRVGKRSFIEQVAINLPSYVCVLFTGTDSGATEFHPTDVAGRTLDPLTRLTFSGYIKARELWGVYPQYGVKPNGEEWTDEEKRTRDLLIFTLGGGLPRWLKIVNEAYSYGWDVGLKAAAENIYEDYITTDLSTVNFVGLLMAGTAYTALNCDATIPTLEHKVPFVDGVRYLDLCQGLIVAQSMNPWLRTVAPFSFYSSPLLAATVLERHLLQAPGHLPQYFNPIMMFLPWRKDLSDFGEIGDHTARGRPFERVVANALVARDYLLRLNAPETKITMHQLMNLPNDPQYDVLKKLDVDLSGGLCFGPTAIKDNSEYDQVGDYYPGYEYLENTDNEVNKTGHSRQISYMKSLFSEENAHKRNQLRVSTFKYAPHDMNILATWNQDYTTIKNKHYCNGDCCYIALQLRHGNPKTGWKLLTQVGGELKVDILLEVLPERHEKVRLNWNKDPDNVARNWRNEELKKRKDMLERLDQDGMLLLIDASRFCRTWMPFLVAPK